MKNNVPTTTIPAVSVSPLTDPSAANDGLKMLEMDMLSLDEKPFLALRTIVRLERSELIFHETSCRLRSYTKIDESLMSFSAIGPRAKGTVDGVAQRPDVLTLSAPGCEKEFVVEAGYNSISLMIPPDNFLEHLLARRPGAEFNMPIKYDFLSSPGVKTRTFYDLAKRIVQTARNNPTLFNENASVRLAANLEIYETLFELLSQLSPVELTQSDMTKRNHSRLIKTVVDYAEREIEEPLYISDLCRVAGVSERTLQYAFQEIMGMTPMAYLKILKLHRARDELRTASKKSTTVSNLAMKWGFWHFGDFSKSYKDRFHESPSETLRMSLALK